MQKSKDKTDTQGAVLSGVRTEQPRNLAPSLHLPSLVAPKSPLRIFSGRKGFSNTTHKAHTIKDWLTHLAVLNQFLYF